VPTNKERQTLKHGGQVVTTVAFSPDSLVLATGSGGGETLRFWDVATGMEHAPLKGSAGAIVAQVFAVDGKTLVSANNHGVLKVWDLSTSSERSSAINPSEEYLHAVFSPDGKTLAIGGSSGTVHLVDTATGKVRATLSGHQGEIHALVFSPDGLMLATSSRDGTVRLWHVDSGEFLNLLKHGQPAGFIVFTPDGNTVISADYFAARFWQTSTGQQRTAWLSARDNGFYPGAITSDGKTLAMGSDAGGNVRSWDITAGKERPPQPLFKENVSGVAFTRDNRILAARSLSGNIKLWDLGLHRERVTLPPCHVWTLAPDSQTIAGNGDEGQIRIWDVANGQVKVTLEGHTARVICLTYSADGQRLASSGQDGRVIFWDPFARKRKIHEWHLPGVVTRVAVAPDGRHVATVNSNGTVFLLRAAAPPHMEK
jgi:WD40 repeat protein